MSEPKIEDCPWCGKSAAEASKFGFCPYIACTNHNCQAMGPSCDTEEKAVEAWNRVARAVQSQSFFPDPARLSKTIPVQIDGKLDHVMLTAEPVIKAVLVPGKVLNLLTRVPDPEKCYRVELP